MAALKNGAGFEGTRNEHNRNKRRVHEKQTSSGVVLAGTRVVASVSVANDQFFSDIEPAIEAHPYQVLAAGPGLFLDHDEDVCAFSGHRGNASAWRWYK